MKSASHTMDTEFDLEDGMATPLPLFDGMADLPAVRRAPEPAAAWPFKSLLPFRYTVIMADPPWDFKTYSAKGAAKSARANYACMSDDAIAALPVGNLACGDCWLWLWATFPMLPSAFFVMGAWGFVYVTGGVWIKRGASGKLAVGTGYILRGNPEPFLIGRVGRPRSCSNSILAVIEAPRREHSRKPDRAYEAAEEVFGDARRADLFSRETRPGWEAWGREAGKFDRDRAGGKA